MIELHVHSPIELLGEQSSIAALAEFSWSSRFNLFVFSKAHVFYQRLISRTTVFDNASTKVSGGITHGCSPNYKDHIENETLPTRPLERRIERATRKVRHPRTLTLS